MTHTTNITFLIGLIVYLFPTLVARARHNPRTPLIAVLNILTGWTLLGWIGALIWAFNSKRPLIAARVPAPSMQPMKTVTPATGTPVSTRPRARSSNAYAAERECVHCHAWIPIMATTCPKCGREAYASST